MGVIRLWEKAFDDVQFSQTLDDFDAVIFFQDSVQFVSDASTAYLFQIFIFKSLLQVFQSALFHGKGVPLFITDTSEYSGGVVDKTGVIKDLDITHFDVLPTSKIVDETT